MSLSRPQTRTFVVHYALRGAISELRFALKTVHRINLNIFQIKFFAFYPSNGGVQKVVHSALAAAVSSL